MPSKVELDGLGKIIKKKKQRIRRINKRCGK